MLYNSPLSLDHLRVFGYLVFATEVRKVDKFASRAVPTIFLGYSTLQKGYKIYTLHTKKFLVSRDVVFKEGVFLFKQVNLTFPSLFPILQFTNDSPIPISVISSTGPGLTNKCTTSDATKSSSSNATAPGIVYELESVTADSIPTVSNSPVLRRSSRP